MTKLSVNVNKVAWLRNSREGNVPDVAEAARIAVEAGADGITVHPRPDLRHIRPADVRALAAMLSVEFNIEGNPFAEQSDIYPGFMALVQEVQPAQCTLVPDDPRQLTSDHGWDITKDGARLEPLIRALRDKSIRVSLFMDPLPEQIRRAADIGADRVELYTGPFAEAFATSKADFPTVFERYRASAEAARNAGLGLNAGHDLNLDNLAGLLQIGGVDEVSIGHALIADALKMGLAAAVAAYARIAHGPA